MSHRSSFSRKHMEIRSGAPRNDPNMLHRSSFSQTHENQKRCAKKCPKHVAPGIIFPKHMKIRSCAPRNLQFLAHRPSTSSFIRQAALSVSPIFSDDRNSFPSIVSPLRLQKDIVLKAVTEFFMPLEPTWRKKSPYQSMIL